MGRRKKITDDDLEFLGDSIPKHLKTKRDNQRKILEAEQRAKEYEKQHKNIPIKHIQSPNQQVQPVGQPLLRGQAGSIPTNNVTLPIMGDTGSDLDLNKIFSSELGHDSDVLKELFSSDNVKVKTDLTIDQISIISRLELQAKITQNFFLSGVIKELETLLISKNRLSRQEFVKSFHGIEEQQQSTMFGKIGNIFNKNDKI